MNTNNGYKLTRIWFDWVFENARKARPIHGILFLWCVEKSNRLGWLEEFQLPSDEASQACGAADRETILKAINDLEKWGFIKVTQQSKNRFTARWIKITADLNKIKGNLNKALMLHPIKSDAMPDVISDAIPNATYDVISDAIPTNIKQVNNKPKTTKQAIPSEKEFMDFVLENSKEVDLDNLKLKYKAWLAADWRDGNGKEIKNWKSKILNTLPYLPRKEAPKNNGQILHTGNANTTLKKFENQIVG